MIRINADYFYHAASLTEKGVDTELNCVYVQPKPDGAWIVSMDGRSGGVFIDKNAVCHAPLLIKTDSKDLIAACKPGKVKEKILTINDTGEAEVTHKGSILYASKNSHISSLQYPNWQAVFRYAARTAPGIDLAWLSINALAPFKNIPPKGDTGAFLMPTPDNGMIFVQLIAVPEFLGVFMPFTSKRYGVYERPSLNAFFE